MTDQYILFYCILFQVGDDDEFLQWFFYNKLTMENIVMPIISDNTVKSDVIYSNIIIDNTLMFQCLFWNSW